MTEKLLPRLQLSLMVLFSLSSLVGPLIVGDVRLLLAYLVGIGLLVGGVTAAIGWRVLLQKKTVAYPFSACSLQALKQFAVEGQPAATPSGPNLVLGAANLGLGFLVVLAMLAASTIIFPS